MPSKCTVFGNLQALTGGAIPQGALTFELINVTPGQMPQVSGTSILPVLRQVVQTAPDGSFSVAIWGNDNIVPPVTNYAITLSDGNGTYLGPLIFTISGGTVNLNSATPTGANVISGAYTWSALQIFSAGISGDGTHIELIPTAINSTLVDLASVQSITGVKTLTNPQLAASSVIKDSAGAVSMGITQKTGSGSGNYTTTSASYSDMDGTNLAFTVTVPVGWKAFSVLTGWGNQSAGANGIAIADSTTILREIQANSTTNGPFVVQAVFNGDGNSHTFKARFKSDGSNTLTIQNTTVTNGPVLSITLVPSN